MTDAAGSAADSVKDAASAAKDAVTEAADAAQAQVAPALGSQEGGPEKAAETVTQEASKAAATVKAETAKAADAAASQVATTADAAKAKAAKAADTAKAKAADAAEAVTGEPTPPPARSMDEIEADLAATRERLAGRLDELQEYVSPKNLIGRQVEKVKGVFVDEYGGIKPDKVLIAAGAVVGVVVLLGVLGRRRRG